MQTEYGWVSGSDCSYVSAWGNETLKMGTGQSRQEKKKKRMKKKECYSLPEVFFSCGCCSCCCYCVHVFFKPLFFNQNRRGLWWYNSKKEAINTPISLSPPFHFIFMFLQYITQSFEDKPSHFSISEHVPKWVPIAWPTNQWKQEMIAHPNDEMNTVCRKDKRIQTSFGFSWMLSRFSWSPWGFSSRIN